MDNYIFLTRDFHALPIADRLKDDGKNVVVGLVEEEENPKTPKGKSEARLSLYEGIIEYHGIEDVLDWMKDLKDKDQYFVMVDYGDLWEYSERALNMGFTRGIFPTEKLYELEQDRKAGKEFAKKNYPNLKVAPYHEFKKVDDAIKFMEEQKDTIFVLKSEGSNAETVVPLTEDAELGRRQIIGALQVEGKDYERGGFTLEPKVKNPLEFAPVMVCWDGVPVFTLLELENKPLGAGNIGRLTGGCQNLTMLTRFDAPINKIAFPPVVFEMAKKQPGLSVFDAGLLFDGKDFYFTEFAASRFGFDGLFAEIAMCGDERGWMNVVNHFDGIASGRNPMRHNFGAAVRMFQTEPHGKNPDMYHDQYAVDWLDAANDQLFFYCIKRMKPEGSKDEVFVSNGYEKDLGVATGTGSTMQQAVDRAYQAVESVAMTGLLYRPKFDFNSRDYFGSIMNRYEFIQNSGLI